MNFQQTLLVGLVTALPFTASLRAAESVQDAFRRGLLAEETTRDLKAAAEAYSEAVRLSADQRAIEATALFRLAECQKKLGNATEANATLQRLAREYPEQRELLAKAGAPAGGPSRSLTSPAMQSLQDQLEATLATLTFKAEEIEALGAKKDQLGKLGGVMFAARVPAEFSNPELTRLISEANQVDIKKAGISPDYGPEHPEMKKLNAMTEALRQQMREQQAAVGERIDEAIAQRNREMQTLRKKAAQMEERLNAMDKEARSIDPSTGIPNSEQSGASTPTPGARSVNEGGRDPAAAKRGSLSSTPLSEADLRSQIDSLCAELEVLQKLPDAADRGRFLVSRHQELTTDAFRGEAGSWSTIPKDSRTNESWLHFESLVKSLIRPLEDRLQFARMELEALQKQREEREPITVLFYGARTAKITFKAREHATLSDAVLQMGDTENVDLRRVRLHRRGENEGEDILTADVQTMLKTGDRRGEIELRNGDRIELKEKGLF